MKTKGNTTWMPHKAKGPMLTNRLAGAQLGFAPAVLAKLAWPWVLRIGGTLLLGSGALYLSSKLVQAAVPSIPINTRNIPSAAILGGLGVASYYTASLLPEKWAPLGYVGAALGLGGAIFMLFKDAAVTTSGEGPAPAAPAETYNEVRAIIESPKQGKTIAASFSGQEYPLKMTWLNNSLSSPISFNFRIKTVETAQGIFGAESPVTNTFLPSSSTPEKKPIDRVTLFPKDSLPIEYTIPLNKIPTGWVASSVVLTIEIFNPHASAWQPVDSRSFVVSRL